MLTYNIQKTKSYKKNKLAINHLDAWLEPPYPFHVN
jgi:hypothetical protein